MMNRRPAGDAQVQTSPDPIGGSRQQKGEAWLAAASDDGPPLIRR